MAKKKINFKAKVSRALSNLLRDDKDLFIKKPNENAYNSNLYRRIGKTKLWSMDMEYDDYEFPVAVKSLSIKKIDFNKNYKPKPDIIAHSKNIRNQNEIIAVVEGKKVRGDVISDYYKIWAYKFLFNIEQGLLVIYPTNEINGSMEILPSKNVGSEAELKEIVDNLDVNNGITINIIFNNHEAERIRLNVVDDLPEVFKKSIEDEFEEKEILLKSNEGDNYVISKSNEGKFKIVDNPASNIIQKFDEHVDISEILPKTKIEELINDEIFLLWFRQFDFNQAIWNENFVPIYITGKIDYDDSEFNTRNCFIIEYRKTDGFVFGLPKAKSLSIDGVRGKKSMVYGYGYKGETWYEFKPLNPIRTVEEVLNFIGREEVIGYIHEFVSKNSV